MDRGKEGTPVKKWMCAALAALLLAGAAPGDSAPAPVRLIRRQGATVLTVEKRGDVWRLEAVFRDARGGPERRARAVTRDRDPSRWAEKLAAAVDRP